tara:strand:- start:34 stop:1197 length:1164 start_codon:yes stop_codon:yes gene_type:complete
MEINKYLKSSAFKLTLSQKEDRLLPLFKEEHLYHYNNNNLYKKIIDNEYGSKNLFKSLETLPFIPVGYFKQSGKSFTSSNKIHRTLLSSSTSGTPSVIDIDNETSKRQILSLTSSLSDFIGKKRIPFLICDVPPEKANFEISARHSAISGFSNFASKSDFILKTYKDAFQLDIRKVEEFISNNSKEPLIICGFTYLIYINLIKFCEQNKIVLKIPENSFLIHIGGWKKLADQEISREKFIQNASDILNLKPKNIIDIYGFTEQMGTVYPECEFGFKHVPDHAHLIVREPYSYENLEDGQIGVGQFLSLVPKSYAGFSLITDDLVKIIGHDNCKCGRNGTYFKVIGRAKSAEIRGCGDVIAEKNMEKSYSIDNQDKATLYYFKSQERL